MKYRINLKPCPKCGSNNVDVYRNLSKRYYIQCGDCGYTTPSTQKYAVIADWNLQEEATK